MQVNYRRRHITTEEKVGVVTDYNSSIPIPQIMERYHISRPTLYRVLKQAVIGLVEPKEEIANGPVTN